MKESIGWLAAASACGGALLIASCTDDAQTLGRRGLGGAAGTSGATSPGATPSREDAGDTAPDAATDASTADAATDDATDGLKDAATDDATDGLKDAATDDATDGPKDAATDGATAPVDRHSYEVTATLTAKPQDGRPWKGPTAHFFTLVVDSEASSALLAGTNGGGYFVAFSTPAVGPVHLGPLAFSTATALAAGSSTTATSPSRWARTVSSPGRRRARQASISSTPTRASPPW